MQSYQTRIISNAGGAAKYLALVVDTTDAKGGTAKLPSGANVPGFCGVTNRDQLTQGRSVSIIEQGRAPITAASAITAGDAVNIANNLGQIQSCQTSLVATSGGPSALHVIGYAITAASASGDVVEVLLNPFTKVTPT